MTQRVRSLFLYFPDDRLSHAELCAARLDGHVVELGEGFIPADAVETTTLRAQSLSPLVASDRLVLARWSAAWIWGVLDGTPDRHHVARTRDHRVTAPLHRRIVFHDVPIDDDDLVRIGGIATTTPVRTAADLARLGGPDRERGARVVRRLVEQGLVTITAIAEWFDGRSRLPGRRLALDLLRALGRDQPDVTR